MTNTALTFLKGHRIRVILSSSNYPKYALNLNDGGPMYRKGVWPYFEKIGARIVGMWKVVTPEGVADGPQASRDYDEVYLMTRYASVEHWRATRETARHGGNGPDWEKCKAALDLRQSLTITSNVIFLKGQMAAGGPYFMPGLDESYEKKAPK